MAKERSQRINPNQRYSRVNGIFALKVSQKRVLSIARDLNWLSFGIRRWDRRCSGGLGSQSLLLTQGLSADNERLVHNRAACETKWKRKNTGIQLGGVVCNVGAMASIWKGGLTTGVADAARRKGACGVPDLCGNACRECPT